MNKIFRIVWSQATQSWVVVSELTKAHKKQSASNAQKSAVKFSGNFIKSSAIALALLSGHSAYAATAAGNTPGEGNANAVAFGPDSNASKDGAVALGKQAKATGNEAAALGKGAKAEGNLSVAVGVNAQASANNAMALGLESKAKGENSVALGRMAEATAESAMALGFNSKATSFNTVALGRNTQASGQRSMAFGNEAKATQNDTIAFGSSSEAKKINDIIIGKEAKSHDTGGGYSIAIGTGAISGSTRIGIETNPKTTEKKGDAGGVAIGTGAYTGVNRDSATPINSSVAIGAGAGAGFRALDDNKIPVGNGTDADDNTEVLRKAFGVNDINADYKAINGGVSGYTSVDINEGTAVGRHARAIGDQAVAIGAQTIAGMGAIALGGNDITQFANKKYYKSTKDNFKVTETTDHTQGATLSEKTISQNYQALVGTALDTNYKATYAQDGSVVLGAQAHSGTPLGTAIGTNALVRKGAFGATAIGAGSQIQANAEAAVAIGMGSVANGAYAVAAGTASRAEYGDIALGYQAKATGKDGAIAMGRATNAQGDSSIMIGGANIGSAAAQNTSFEKGNGTVTKKTVIEKINGKDVSREYTFAGTTKTNGTVAVAYKELTGRDMETNALNFADNKYKNGHASTSLGVHALSKGDLGTAIGASSRADAIGSVALGTGAHATKQNAVAIGTGSTTELVGTRQLSVSYDKDGNIVDDNSPDKAYTFNWAGGINTAEGDVVSFGSSGAERQLKNVAAGRVADDSTDAINGSQLNSIAKKVAYGWNIAGDNKKQTASVGSEDQVNFVNGNGTTVTVEKQEEVKSGDKVTTPKGANVKFDIKAADGSITSDAKGISVNTDGDTIGKTADGKLKANTGTINTGNDGKAAPNTGDGNKLATVDTVVNAVNNAAWKATAGKDGSGTETGKSEEKIKAGDLVTFKAGDNLAIKQAGKDFIYSLNPVLTGLTSATFTNAAGDTTVIDGNGMTITPKDASANPVSLTKDGLDNGGKTIKNVTSGLTNYPAGTPKDGLVDLSKPATGNPAVPDTTAATVGDLRNMGWVVSSDKTTGELTKAYTDQVKNADEVKFVGEGGVTVSGKTENGVRTITVKAEAQEMPEQPVSYTTADGTRVYPVKDKNGNVTYHTTPDGKGQGDKEIPKGDVITSINGPEGTKAPTTLSNVAGNLDGAKKGTTSPTTNAAAPNNVDGIKNNAATVGDVLNAGWNLQGNGVAKDFVKPYDTVNFVDGMNTRAVVTTDADGKVSNVQIDVKDLPIAYTNAAGDKVVKGPDNKYYKESDLSGKVYDPVTKMFKNANGTPLAAQPTEVAKDDIKTNLVNPNAEGNKAGDPTELGNVKSGLDTIKDANGGTTPSATDKAAGLVNLTNDKVSDNNAATVGDLRKMGWVVSSDKATDGTGEYSDQVKNANEVRFVGKGTAKVSGKTEGNVRTITVEVNDQVSTNNSVTPVVYTKADGTKVYPIKQADGTTKFFTEPDGTGTEVPASQVITSVNGPDGTKNPTTLKNVAGNLEGAKKDTTSPTTNAAAPNNVDDIKNNAATVGDVLNAGWNLQGNGVAKDFVKPYDTVNFVNGLGTTAVVTTHEGSTISDVTFNVKPANGSVTVDEDGVKVTTGEMKPAVGTDSKETGAIATPADPATAKQLKETLAAAEKDLSAAREALKDAEKALAANPKDPALQQAVADKKADVAAKQTPVEAAQKAHDEAGLNKVATVQNVAEAINNAGFNLKTSADGGEKLTGTKDDGELIKPSNTVEMVAGNNLAVKQDENGKITYATKDNVTFKTVDTGTLNVGSPDTYTDGKGNTYTKVGDKYYKPADVVNGAPKPDATPVDVTATPVTPVSPVTMKAEAAKPATNNASDAQPSSALNVTSKDGKPTQITGVGSTLNTKSVDTTPAGTAPGTTPNTTPANLVDLEGTADAPVNKNAAATVGDLQNMGWVVSAKDGNGYKDVVKNANVVDFKGDQGVTVTGKTLEDGTREITVGIKEGEVTNKVTITHADGSKTEALKIGDNYYKVDKDGKPEGFEKDENGKPAGTPLTVDPKTDKVTNTGAGVVTGNTVANAIQESGWNVGIGSTDKDFSKDAKVYDKVNPNDDVKFADGANTNVSMVTVDALNEDGTKKATTYVKVDVNRDLKIDSVTTGGTAVDKNGNNLVKVGDDYYKESDIDPVTKQPKADAKPVPKADVTPAKDGAMTVKDAKGNDGVSATAKDGKGTLTLKDAGKDGKDASQVDISTAKAPADLENTPKDAVRANDGKWYDPADVDVKTENGKTVVTPKDGKSPIADAPTIDRIQYTGKDGKPRNVATMDDGLRFVGDDGETISKPLNSTMEFTGGNRENGKPVAKENTTTGNIGVFHDNGKLSVQLAKDLEKMNSANFETPDGTSTKITGNGLSVTPETAKLKDPKTGKPVLDKDGNPKVDPKKVVSFGGPTIMKDPKTGKPVVDSKTGEPVMESGISAGGQVMTNVAPGRISPTSTDAVNGSQLHAVASSIGNLNNKINKVGKHADAGTASALAASNIPQAYTPGKSLVGIAAGSYQGQTGVAVGMSRISDNGKIIIRLSGTTNTQGRAGVAAGVGYQW